MKEMIKKMMASLVATMTIVATTLIYAPTAPATPHPHYHYRMSIGLNEPTCTCNPGGHYFCFATMEGDDDWFWSTNDYLALPLSAINPNSYHKEETGWTLVTVSYDCPGGCTNCSGFWPAVVRMQMQQGDSGNWYDSQEAVSLKAETGMINGSRSWYVCMYDEDVFICSEW